ncbi:WD40 repeat domain-containing protein, partial [Kitasatospora arboriphila]|uniref:WD40 repeat domain-containing protein n=1 Tax=Kitasatospora arboriphila TaxID=258052 RepID=UPI003CD09677
MNDTGRGSSSGDGRGPATAPDDSHEVTGHVAPEWHTAWVDGPAADPRLRRTLTGHDGPAKAVAVAVVDGRPMVVSAGRDTTVRVWDTATGQQVHAWPSGRTDRLSSVTAEALALAVAEVDGRPLVLGLDTDEAVTVRDLRTGRPVGEVVALVERTELDGRAVLLTMDAARTLQVWDEATGGLLGAHPAVVTVCTLGGRRTAVSAPGDRPVEVRDLVPPAGGTSVGESRPVLRARLYADGTAWAETPATGGTPRFWDLDSGLPLAEAELPRTQGSALHGVSELTVAHGRAVAVTLDHQAEPELTAVPAAGRAALDARTTDVRLGERRVALVAGSDGVLHRWDLTADRPHGDGPRTFTGVPAGHRTPAPAPGPGGSADLWALVSARTNGGLAVLGPTGPDGRPAVSRRTAHNGRPAVLTAEEDGTVATRPTADATPPGPRLTGHTGRVWALDTVTAGAAALAVTTGLDRTVRVWDTTTGRQLGEPLTGHAGQVWDVAAAVVDGRPVCVTAGDDGTLRTWDLAGPPSQGADDGHHTAPVRALATAEADGRPGGG